MHIQSSLSQSQLTKVQDIEAITMILLPEPCIDISSQACLRRSFMLIKPPSSCIRAKQIASGPTSCRRRSFYTDIQGSVMTKPFRLQRWYTFPLHYGSTFRSNDLCNGFAGVQSLGKASRSRRSSDRPALRGSRNHEQKIKKVKQWQTSTPRSWKGANA